MSRSLSDVDRDTLSKEAAFVFDEIAWKLAVDDLTPRQIAERYGLETGDITAALAFLGSEIEAQLGGARLPALEELQYELLKEDIRERGQLVPITVTAAGEIVDGKNRMRICRELGREPLTHVVDVDDPYASGLALQLNRRQLSRKQVRHVIRVELLRDGDRADRDIARLIGVHHETVGAVRKELERLVSVLAESASGHKPAATQTAAAPAKPKTIAVREDVYNALFDVARHAATYYGAHEIEHRSPELEEALSRWHELNEGSA